MGLLDDAIREHLELKRRRGDDPALIERAEREALGPVRRDAPDEPASHEPLHEAAAELQEEPVVAPEAPADDFAWEDAERDRAAETAASAPTAHPAQETHEYDVEAALEQERDRASQHGEAVQGDEEDVLEETPDFLQETPEHDRLWFEQRPPRDFDFDG